jgi:pilus assembly protein Flp/PilA
MIRTWMIQFVELLKSSERGQDLAEYGLLVALIALAVVVALGFVGGQISNLFQALGNYLNSLTTP